MKKLLTMIAALALSGCAEEPEFIQRTICAREETREVQVCHSDTAGNVAGGAILGGLAGHLIGVKPKTGALIGGAIGAANSGTSRCHMEKEKYCAEYKSIQEPNPRFKKKEK